MIEDKEFKDIPIKTMFLWSGLYIVKTKPDFGEYTPGKEFYFFKHEHVRVDDRCREYNKELADEAGK